MQQLEYKNTIVTGASRGLGVEIARHFWQRGANILLVARDVSSLRSIVNSLEHRPHQQAHIFAADLADENSTEKVIEFARTRFEQIHILVNNAAIQGPIGSAWSNDWLAWQQTIRVNLLSPIDLSRHCAEWMIPYKQGKIISLSGGGATGTRPNFSAYAVAKTGLVRFSEILADELKEHNIQVNCIAPGAMATSLLNEVVAAGSNLAGQKEFEMANKVKSGGGTSPENAARLAVFLASAESDGITGKLISAVWDPWDKFSEHLDEMEKTDIYTLRRIVPKDRGIDWGDV